MEKAVDDRKLLVAAHTDLLREHKLASRRLKRLTDNLTRIRKWVRRWK